MDRAERLFGWILAISLAVAISAASADDTSAKKTGVLVAKGKGNAMVRIQQGALVLTGKGDLWVSEGAKVDIEGTSGTKSAKTLREVMDANRPEGMPGGPGGPGGPGDMRGQGPGGPPEDARDGNRPAPPEEKGYLYKGLSGKVTIEGEKFSADLQGEVSQLEAKGIGIAMLRGEGTYTVTKDGEDAKTEGKWMMGPGGFGPGGPGGPGGPRGGPGGPPQGGDRGEGRPEMGSERRPPMPFITFGDAEGMQMPGMPGMRGRGPRQQ
jgi:hypothetical protein